MAETLGSLCDKLTIVKLKQWHASDQDTLKSLSQQERQLRDEIGEYLGAAVAGQIPFERLTFAANKVYRKEGNPVGEVSGTIGEVFGRLADVNIKLWHEQERVYEFERVPPEQKDAVVKQLAILNLERNRCIDQLNNAFKSMLEAAAAPPSAS
ncbi:MAG: hypothetical protein WB699_10955 [Bacteroidota bacterium]